MTRDEAVQIAILGSSRLIRSLRQERPQWLCDRLEIEAAEDSVDLLVAFGLIKLDQPLVVVGHVQVTTEEGRG